MLKKARTFVASIFAGLLLAGLAVAGETVKGVQIFNEADRTHLVINLSAPVKYTTAALDNPDRLVIDLRDTQLAADLDKLDLQDSPIKRLRSGIRNGTSLRLVLDLDSSVKAKSTLLKADGELSDRLAIDLYSRGAKAAKTAKADKTDKANKSEKAEKSGKVEVASAEPARLKPLKSVSATDQRDIVIAIDAGHGGEDPGAIGPGRLQEKRVAFAIAKELAELFEKERGYKPVLVRKGDYFLPLKTRRDLARKAQADLMVSIHADAFNDPSVQGGSVFALSDRGATSTMAAFLATSENQADAIGGVSTAGKDDDLVKVLADLSLTATMDASMRVGRHVLKSMGGVTSLHTSRVEQAAFVVLKSPDTPSILVETGFISNPKEAQRLASKDHQEKLARAIFDGINRYFFQTPPPNTYIAWVKRNGTQQAALAATDKVASVEP